MSIFLARSGFIMVARSLGDDYKGKRVGEGAEEPEGGEMKDRIRRAEGCTEGILDLMVRRRYCVLYFIAHITSARILFVKHRLLCKDLLFIDGFYPKS